MILVDTSVWIDFFRDATSAPALPGLLQENGVVSHPWILGEFMMGAIGPRRKTILSDLRFLPQLPVHSVEELSDFVERERIFGQGLSLVDVQLLYASIIENCLLWTHDLPLRRVAKRYGRATL